MKALIIIAVINVFTLLRFWYDTTKAPVMEEEKQINASNTMKQIKGPGLAKVLQRYIETTLSKPHLVKQKEAATKVLNKINYESIRTAKNQA